MSKTLDASVLENPDFYRLYVKYPTLIGAENLEKEEQSFTKIDRYYHAYFSRVLKEQGIPLKFNWAAAFFGVGWMMYRRMWLFAAIFLVLHPLIFGMFMLENDTWQIGATIGFFIIQGLYGNYLYFLTTKQKYYENICPPSPVNSGVVLGGIGLSIMVSLVVSFIYGKNGLPAEAIPFNFVFYGPFLVLIGGAMLYEKKNYQKRDRELLS